MTGRFPDGVPELDSMGTVHLIGVGGAGMSVVARLLHDRGLRVQGSDAHDGPVLESLRAAGVPVWVGHDAGHVADAHTVVVSSAVPESNPELAQARRAGLRVLHRSQALAALMATSRAVAVAGAHGKTTTSAMIAVALTHAGLHPSFAIGGSVRTAHGTVSGGHLGSGDVIVAEADESDGSFLNYRPLIAVVTNVEPDHLDHYGSREAFEHAFEEFARRIVPGGWLVACADDAGSARLASAHRGSGGNVLTYGFGSAAAHVDAAAVVPDLLLEDYAATPGGGGSATVTLRAGSPVRDGRGWTGRLDLAVPGPHNALNAAAALAALVLLEVDPDEALAGLASFTGTGRRFEDRGTAGGVRVVDDYAHHPTEVAALMRAARSVAGEGRVLVLFQPHLFSRTQAFADRFAAALDGADHVVVTGIYGARESPVPGVDSTLITEQMRTPHAYVPDKADAARAIASCARSGDLVLTVGAGDVTDMGPIVL
ncbi:MAG: UDP-N-acetylmuramate--L-alanine ligase, partial [Cellulomonadaceae bacterium]